MSAEGLSAEREDAPVVLIVEDEKDLAELYAAGLGETYAVRMAFDGEQALEQLDESVDVVLLDRRMPRLSGDEVLDQIRERGYDCRVVMVSAVEPDFDVLEMGFDDYVSKPVSADDLRDTVDRMLELATHDSALQEYHALVSKKIALEAKKSLRELAESGEYAELKAEIAERREEMDAERADLQEALASAAVFEGLDASTAAEDSAAELPSDDGPSEPPFVRGATDAGAEAAEGAVSNADIAAEGGSGAVTTGDTDSDAGRTEPSESDTETADGTAGDRSPETTDEELAVLNRLLRHDLINDMALVSGWLERLREEVTADQGELLDRAIAATDHAIELTRSVGELVRANDEPGSLDLEAVGLDDVVEQEVEKVRQTYEGATITVEDLPSVEVRANDLLSSIVGNLLRNAVQHTDADDPRVELSVEVGFHDATLRIADDGPGIPEERREALFEEGWKGAESAGLGIGLSLVKRLVDVYDGTISIEDNDPRGTVVTVELPKAG